jgi:hypothetical protein
MEYATTQALRKLRRRAFLLGKRSMMFPDTRDKAIALARRALSFLPLRYRVALVADMALPDVEEMTRCASMSLATAVVLARRMPVLERALFTQQIFTEARLLLHFDDAVGNETRH